MIFDKRAILRIFGAIIGAGVTAAFAIKKTPHVTTGQRVMGGMATIGGATVGYYVAGWVANRILVEPVETLPDQQAQSLPGGSTPASTPSSQAAMGAVAERAAAVTQSVSSTEVAKGTVIDMQTEKSNVIPFKPPPTMDVSAFGSEQR